jgi:SAM-dependent methyltransferase
MPVDEREAAVLGCPSYGWRFGQERRLALIERYAPLKDRTVLDVGCGLGMYTERLRRFSQRVYGVDVELGRLREAKSRLPNLAVAQAEGLPYPDDTFDVVLLHEVIEHVDDDHTVIEEAYRVTKPRGRIVVFAPNRLYPFETHGIYWQGRYRFGNIPLVNYLPQFLRRRLIPHVRAYTTGDMHSLFKTLPHRVIVHTQIYPGYDGLAARKPHLASILRRLTYSLEKTPFRVFGLSHFLVVEKP